MAEETVQQNPPPLTPEERRNFLLCLGNGTFVSMGWAFFAFETVMAGLAFELTQSPLLVGVLTSSAALGWQWPQLFVGNWIEHRERKMPVYKAAVSLRLLANAGLIASVLCFPHQNYLLYGLLLLCTLAITSGGGVVFIPFMDIVAKAIPVDHRPMLFAYRKLFGGLLGFCAGLITYYVLSDKSGIQYPHNYAFLWLGGLGLSALAYAMFLGVKEPIEPVMAQRTPFLQFLKRGPALFKQDRDFRLFYLYRVFFHLSIMSNALLVPFVMDVFDAPLNTTGGFAAAVALTTGISSFTWGNYSRRHGEIVLFRWGTILLLIAPSLALLAALYSASPGVAAWISAHCLVLCLLVYSVHTTALTGNQLANTLYLMALPPPEQRPMYMAFMNTLSAPLNFMPILAGALVSMNSYAFAFGVSTASTLLAIWAGWQLKHRRG